MKFREDIQGLRALAVLSVVIYHISPFHLPGGFIGVDIFFVISGYLIMGQIYGKIHANNFSFSDFYVRRFKRLFPAYIATVAITSIFAFVYFLPGEFNKYAWSLVASCLYVSNFYFYTKSGYFDSELQGSPLLHTWSLSVEEQFYAIMPVFLIFAYGMCKKYSALMLGCIFTVSFILCIYLTNNDLSFAFFASFTRFWQFIAGGIIAIYGLHVKKTRITSEILSSMGVLILLASCVLLTHDEFPGIKALIPTLATVVVLSFSSSGLILYKLLSLKPAIFVGNISYSLYLWHWPVIIFYQLHFETELRATDKVIVFLLSFILGTASYYLIEEKFRKHSKILERPGRKVYLSVVATSTALCAIVFFLTFLMPSRFSEKQIAYEQFMEIHEADYFRPGVCFLTSKHPDISYFNQEQCLIAEKGKENILLVGDSHAAHWYIGLNANKKPNQTVSQVTASGCKPTISYKGERRCTELMRYAFEQVIPTEKYDKIIISARWKMNDLPWLLKTLQILEEFNTEVTIFGPIIEYTQPLPRILAHADFDEKLLRTRKYDFIESIDTEFNKELSEKEIRYISILHNVCATKEDCTILVEDEPLQFDYGHVTEKASVMLLKDHT
ncbi:acyltransferase family protein [Alteromonas sp. 345S023]|uniref:Acyltransferase family protein n=1 Tax=Alteromonas profundi TaxID=2696062 RepID=A0A7X5LIH3_9ALTE|nr:acyltransferase family protein [Alteromonas profundi]NDV89967.1 acyltransferase family protein [Alteromonas profundi]